MPMSNDFAMKLANLITLNTPIAAYASANRYLALHSADPTKTCAVGELSGDGYQRVLIPLTIVALAKGVGVANNEVIVFPKATGTKGVAIIYGSVWDSLNAGTPITYGALKAPANWVEDISLALAVNSFIQLLRDTL